MADRQCGSCTLCCKVLAVRALDKPLGAWCVHCLPGKGCGIYERRPEECRTFHCGWIGDETLGPEWKPEKSKIVLTFEAEQNRVVAYVDPATPAAWKRAPYREGLQEMMLAGLPHKRLVYVSVAGRFILLLPDREEELGLLGAGDTVALASVSTPAGIEYRVSVRKD